jgi:shikimate 5-dehydrogenase
MKQAVDAGMRVVNGRNMFIFQALEAFRIWTGIDLTPQEIPPDVC